MGWWLRLAAWLDYALLLRLAACAPRWLGLSWAVLRGAVNAALDADWRTISLGHRYVRRATLQTMRTWCAKNNIQSAWMPWWLTLRRFVHASVEELDAVQLARLSRWPDWSVSGLEGLQAALARGQGVVLLTAHFDSLYMGLVRLAQQGVKVHLVSTQLVHDERIPPAIARHFADKIATMDGLLKPGGGVFHVEHSMRALVRALKDGGVVVIAADGPASTAERATPSRFWGDDFLMVPGPEFLARSAGALVGCYLSWWEGGRLRVEISEPTPLARGGMERAFGAMERTLFRMPWRWWSSDLFQTYRPAPVAGPERAGAQPPVVARPGQWPVLDLSPADVPDVRVLFERVFGHPMSVALHAWKYADGRGMACGMRNDQGTLVVHYGGTLRGMQWGAVQGGAVQLGDSMVAPEARDVFARFGPFGRVARHFIAEHLGPGRMHVVGFGFPNARAARLGVRLGLYWPVAPVNVWRWPLAALRERAHSGWVCRMFDWGSPADVAVLDDLARHMAHELAASDGVWLVRHADWWRHRYAHHPEHGYRVLLVAQCEGGAPVGALVLRPSGGDWELMDWVGPLSFVADVPSAVARVCVGDASCTGLLLWCTPGVSRHGEGAWEPGAEVSLACEAMFTHEQVHGRPVAGFAQTLWLTGGDTDFR